MKTTSSIVALLIAFAVIYIGISAIRGAQTARRANEAFDAHSAVVSGRIVGHELETLMDNRRTSIYKPVVEYVVDHRGYRVTAQHGSDLKGSLTQFTNGLAVEVRYLVNHPGDARVIGFDSSEKWIPLIITGIVLICVPLGIVILALYRRFLFAPA